MADGSGAISVKAEIDECLKFFDHLDVNKAAITKGLMTAVGRGARKTVRQNLNHYLHRRSGTLKSRMKYVVYGKNVDIYSDADSGKRTAKDGRTARYAFMLAAGYTIKAKTSKGLTFNINGQWFRKYSVKVEPKDFVEPSVEKYMRSTQYKADIDKEFQKQIDKAENKIIGGSK